MKGKKNTTKYTFKLRLVSIVRSLHKAQILDFAFAFMFFLSPPIYGKGQTLFQMYMHVIGGVGGGNVALFNLILNIYPIDSSWHCMHNTESRIWLKEYSPPTPYAHCRQFDINNLATTNKIMPPF